MKTAKYQRFSRRWSCFLLLALMSTSQRSINRGDHISRAWMIIQMANRALRAQRIQFRTHKQASMKQASILLINWYRSNAHWSVFLLCQLIHFFEFALANMGWYVQVKVRYREQSKPVKRVGLHRRSTEKCLVCSESLFGMSCCAVRSKCSPRSNSGLTPQRRLGIASMKTTGKASTGRCCMVRDNSSVCFYDLWILDDRIMFWARKDKSQRNCFLQKQIINHTKTSSRGTEQTTFSIQG